MVLPDACGSDRDHDFVLGHGEDFAPLLISVQIFAPAFPDPTYHTDWHAVLPIIARFASDWMVLISVGSHAIQVDLIQQPSLEELFLMGEAC